MPKLKFKHKRILAKIRHNRWVQTITYFGHYYYEKSVETNSSLKKQFFQSLPFLFAAAITGLVAVLYALLFNYAEHLSFYILDLNPYLIFIVAPICFLFSWWVTKKYSPNSKGSGIPQVMSVMELKNHQKGHASKLLGLKIIFFKIISSCIKVVGGGISGREGPTIQIASSIFYLVHKYLPKWWEPISQKNMLIAGASSGLAAAFNTPLGGIIFAIEELSKFHIKYYKSPLFIAVIIAGLTAQGLTGPYLYLGYPKVSASGFKVVLAVLLVTIVCGYFGSRMCVVIFKVMGFFKRIKKLKFQALFVVVSGLFVAAFIYWMGVDAMGSGKEIIETRLFTDNKHVEWYLPFVRMNGLIASFSFGGAGGVFAPSLSAGASFGALTAQLLDFTGQNANLIILIGMTAFLTGVTRAPFTSAIIVFEMTDRHSVIFYLLLGAILANIIASLVDKKSFYERLKDNYLEEISEKEKSSTFTPKVQD
ncbi:chloride channel protein [Moheibacter lacus]|uniref:Chloride channel protein n=1 Tax=Moheibacter lacus TaxID=2745851 RepID=A0A838ZNV7_9FLAO|nr:chloride channel protein [Moheibacter lacus]MBA5629690.1 chloride channel protein [Moheibacter lacus]